MTYSEVTQAVSEQLGISEETIVKCYRNYWAYVKKVLEKMTLKQHLTEEEFNNIRTSVNIPEIGKFGCTYKRYKQIRERYGRIQEKNDGRKPSVGSENR